MTTTTEMTGLAGLLNSTRRMMSLMVNLPDSPLKHQWFTLPLKRKVKTDRDLYLLSASGLSACQSALEK